MATTNPATDKLKSAGGELLKVAGEKAMKTASDRVGDLTDRFEDVANGGPIGKAFARGAKEKATGGSPTKGALSGLASGIKDKVTGGGGKSNKSPKATKATNIIESIDVGVPLRVAYNQWTEFGSFPSFMKKVESVEAVDDNKINFKAQIVWSHRTWEATILEQIPDVRIVWRSKGAKGYVDGAVTFHELDANMTRILIVLEYYPQGLFERTGNIWRAQGRRVRAEFKHFRRHVMTRTILDSDEVEGWRGTIEDGEVVETHEDALEREEQEREAEEQESDEQGEGHEDEYEEGEEPEESDEEEPEDEYDEEYEEEGEEEGEEPEDEYEEGEEPDESDEEEPEDEYDEEYGEEEEEPEDEYEDEEEPEEEEPRRRRAS